jgi:hypothetical protein
MNEPLVLVVCYLSAAALLTVTLYRIGARPGQRARSEAWSGLAGLSLTVLAPWALLLFTGFPGLLPLTLLVTAMALLPLRLLRQSRPAKPKPTAANLPKTQADNQLHLESAAHQHERSGTAEDRRDAVTPEVP